MYTTSQNYKNAISSLARSSKVNGTIKLVSGDEITISDTDIKSGTLSIDTACVNYDDFELGAMYSSNLNVELFSTASRYDLYGATIELKFGLLLSDGSYEYIPLGIFYISTVTRSTNTIKITAVDALEYKMSKEPVTLQSGTPYYILTLASLSTGVELAQTEAEINAMSALNADTGAVIPLKLNNTMGFGQWRQVVGEVAKTLGGYATIGRDGKLYIKRFVQTSPSYLYANNIKKSTISDYTVKYDGVEATIDNTSYSSGSLVGNTFETESDLWSVGTDSLKTSLLSNIWQAIQTVNYTPIEVSYTGDPSLDIGDAVIIRDKNGNEYTSYIMKYSWTHKGNSTIKSVGSNPLLESVKYTNSYSGTSTSASINSNLFNIISETFSDISASANEAKLCELDAFIKQDTKVIISGQLVIDVSADGIFNIIVKINDEQLDYETKTYLTAGYHTIDIFNTCVLTSIDTPNYIEVYIYSQSGVNGQVLSGVCTCFGRILGDEYNQNTNIVVTDTTNVLVLQDNESISYSDTYTTKTT